MKGYLILAAGLLLGCGGPTRDAKQFLDLAPAQPAMAGTYDFELLGNVVGNGCADRGTGASLSAAVLGVHLGSGLVGQAEAAAVFDALSKLQGADTVVITRAVTDGDTSTRVCATIYGRAVRLTKGPTIAPAAPTTAAKAEEPKTRLPSLVQPGTVH